MIRHKLVRSKEGVELNAKASIDSIDGRRGLILESRGGRKGGPNERNTDYSKALEFVLERLLGAGISRVAIYLVSANAIKAWDMENRRLEFDSQPFISLHGDTVEEIRKSIGREVGDKKERPTKGSGNNTKRILIDALVDFPDASWQRIIEGHDLYSGITEDEIGANDEVFDPADRNDGKDYVVRSIAARRGQKKFRDQLLEAYQGACSVTGSAIPEILEAAHIVPYDGADTNHVTNGLLLRADIHTLFDLDLIHILEDYTVRVSASLLGSEYEKYDYSKINLPANEKCRPSILALKQRISI